MSEGQKDAGRVTGLTDGEAAVIRKTAGRNTVHRGTVSYTHLLVVGLNTILIGFSNTAVSLFGIYYKLQTRCV